jgi:hypothetical protein
MKPSSWWLKSTSEDASTDPLLEACFTAAREEDYGDTRAEVESWLRREAVRPTPAAGLAPRVRRLVETARQRRRLTFAGLSLVALLMAGAVPVPRDVAIGFLATWTIDQSPTEALAFLDAHPWIDRSRLSLSTQGTEQQTTFILILPETGAEAVAEQVAALEKLDDVQALSLIPLQERVHRPAYEVALQLLMIDVASPTRDAAETARRIQAQLQGSGLDEATVVYQKRPRGEHKIEITTPE